jgi:hypothetical protein
MQPDERPVAFFPCCLDPESEPLSQPLAVAAAAQAVKEKRRKADCKKKPAEKLVQFIRQQSYRPVKCHGLSVMQAIKNQLI